MTPTLPELDWLLAEFMGVVPDWKWHPTTSIEQAFMVLAKIGRPWRLEYCGPGWENPFACFIDGTDELYGDYADSAKTPECAASLAARAWLESRGK